MDRKIPLPDDVMRTKTFVLHPTSLEHATEQLEQVLLTSNLPSETPLRSRTDKA